MRFESTNMRVINKLAELEIPVPAENMVYEESYGVK